MTYEYILVIELYMDYSYNSSYIEVSQGHVIFYLLNRYPVPRLCLLYIYTESIKILNLLLLRQVWDMKISKVFGEGGLLDIGTEDY